MKRQQKPGLNGYTKEPPKQLEKKEPVDITKYDPVKAAEKQKAIAVKEDPKPFNLPKDTSKKRDGSVDSDATEDAKV